MMKLYVWRLKQRCLFAVAENQEHALELVIQSMLSSTWLSEKKLRQYVAEKVRDVEVAVYEEAVGFFILGQE